MSWVGAIVDAASNNQQAEAADNAATQSKDLTKAGMGLNLALYNQGRQDNLNGLVTGNSALNQLAKMYGLDYYTGQVNTNPITMSGGDTTTDRQSLGEKIMDPGGFFNGQKSTTTPITFSTGQPAGGNGSGAPGSIATGTGYNDYSQFYDSPEYRTAYNEAMQGSDRLAAATGRFTSGGHLSDVARLGANIGNQYLGQYTNNLLSLAGYGQSAGNSLAAQGQNYGNSTSSALANMAGANANGIYDAANARSASLSSLGNAFGNYLGNRQANSGLTTNTTDYGAFSPNNGSSFNFNQSGWW